MTTKRHVYRKKDMMEKLFKFFKSYVFYTTSAFGISLTLVAGVGVSSYNSLNLALAGASGFKVGTMTIIINGLFLLLYMLLTKFKHLVKYLIQLLSVLMFGSLINVFTYQLLGQIGDVSYFNRLILLVLGTSIGGLSVGGIVHYNMITFPLESVCLRLSESSPFTFMHLRYSVDVIAVTLSLVLSFTYGLPVFVREGTIISMLLLSLMITTSKRFFENRQRKPQNI